MILVKNGIERELTNQETIKIFKNAGWEEKEIEDGILENSNKTIIPEPIKKQPKKTTKSKK